MHKRTSNIERSVKALILARKLSVYWFRGHAPRHICRVFKINPRTERRLRARFWTCVIYRVSWKDSKKEARDISEFQKSLREVMKLGEKADTPWDTPCVNFRINIFKKYLGYLPEKKEDFTSVS
jgi:hypothetical protein